MSFYDTESEVVVQSWNFQVKLLWYLGCPKKILVPFLLEAVAADLSVVCDLKWQIVSRLCYEFHKRQYILNSVALAIKTT